MSYNALEPDKIISTAERLEKRIGERFPGSGLLGVASELVAMGRDTSRRATALEQPIWWIRLFVGAVTLLGTLTFIFVGTFFTFDRVDSVGFDFVQGVEAAINTLVLAGLGYITLFKWEERHKRAKVMEGLHALRSIIHVIDMHQLTKDPIVFSDGFEPTVSSPKREMTPAQLSRYLDYCTEMLAITGKLAALYAQAVRDTEIADAVNDVEMLGSNLARKIWQKIMLVDTPRPERQPSGAKRTKRS